MGSANANPGLREALRGLRLPKRAPTEADRPPPASVFPGRKPKLIDGQLDLEGNVYTAPARRKKPRPDDEHLSQPEYDRDPWAA